MFEKYVRNDIGGGPFFFLKAVDLNVIFFICYISIFFVRRGGGELLTCTVHS